MRCPCHHQGRSVIEFFEQAIWRCDSKRPCWRNISLHSESLDIALLTMKSFTYNHRYGRAVLKDFGDRYVINFA